MATSFCQPNDGIKALQRCITNQNFLSTILCIQLAIFKIKVFPSLHYIDKYNEKCRNDCFTTYSYTICQTIDSPLSTSISPSFFHSRLKTFLSTNRSHRNLPFLLHGLPVLSTDTSEHISFHFFFFSTS